MDVLLVWEENEEKSWNPVLGRLLRKAGHTVAEVSRLEQLEASPPEAFEVCLPRFRVGAASMACIDEVLVRSGVAMINSRESRRACENKALAHTAFELAGLPQPGYAVCDREGTLDRRPGWDGETLIKPLHGNRSAGIDILPDPLAAVERAREREEDLLVQQMIWPARCWRVVVGRNCGVVDPYWRRPPHEDERVLAISTGSTLARDECPQAVADVALEMLDAVGGDLLAADVLERGGDAWALEINHNFDAHGGDEQALAAFEREIRCTTAAGALAATAGL